MTELSWLAERSSRKKSILPTEIKIELILKSTLKNKNSSEIESSEIRNIYYQHC
jgi:hypothetical protein